MFRIIWNFKGCIRLRLYFRLWSANFKGNYSTLHGGVEVVLQVGPDQKGSHALIRKGEVCGTVTVFVIAIDLVVYGSGKMCVMRLWNFSRC